MARATLPDAAILPRRGKRFTPPWYLLPVLLALAVPTWAAAKTKITLVQSTHSFNFNPLSVARSEGHFAGEGLEADVVLAGGGPKAVTALLGGGGQVSASVLLDGIMAHRRDLTDVRAMATLSLACNSVVIRAGVAKQRRPEPYWASWPGPSWGSVPGWVWA